MNYKAQNWSGRIPVYRRIIYTSGGCFDYLTTKHFNTPLLPRDPIERKKVYRLLELRETTEAQTIRGQLRRYTRSWPDRKERGRIYVPDDVLKYFETGQLPDSFEPHDLLHLGTTYCWRELENPGVKGNFLKAKRVAGPSTKRQIFIYSKPKSPGSAKSVARK